MTKNSIVFFSVIIFVSCFTGRLHAQINTDSLLTQAKQYAKSNDYAKAENICNSILVQGDNGDVRFYLGLLYSWDGKYNEARQELKKVQETRPKSQEVIVALANNELWSENPQAALDILNKALADDPNNEEYLYLKARALNNLKQYDEALAVLDKLIATNPNNDKAKSLQASVKIASMKNALQVDVAKDYIKNDKPWYLAYIQYSRKTKIGKVIGRLNYANRFNSEDFQFEADAYPSVSKHSYLYLNAGFSRVKLFPKYRFGAEYYQGLPKSFEASLGFRYLRFTYSDVTIYTGSVGKYWGNFWFSFREFVTPDSKSTSYTEILQVRRYFGDAENYIGLQYSHGSSPDDIQTYLRSAYGLALPYDKIKLSLNHRFAKVWIGAISAAYEKNIYSIDISLQRIF